MSNINLNFKKNFFEYVKTTLKENKINSFLTISFYLLYVATYFLFIFFGSALLDEIFINNNEYNRNFFLIVVLSLLFVTYIFDYLYHFFLIKIISKFIYDIKKGFFIKIDTLSCVEIEDSNIFLFPIIYADYIRLENNFAILVSTILNEITITIMILISGLVFNSLLFLSTLVFFPFLIILYIFFLKMEIKEKVKAEEDKTMISSYYYESYLNGYIFNDENSISLREKEINRKDKNRNKYYLAYSIFDNLINSIFSLSLFLSIFSLILFGAIFLNQRNFFANSSMIQIGFLTLLFNISISKLMVAIKELYLDRNSVRKIKEFLEYNVESIDGNDIDDEITEIEFDDVSIIKDKKKLLYNFSLDVKRNEKIAIVGQIASSKSIIYQLLLKELKRSDGNIILNGKNIDEYSKKSLYKNISLVDNNPHIYNTTLKNNLLLNETKNEYMLNDLISSLELDDLIFDLNDGLNTIINSSSLSSGEKEKIALCRAILKDPSIYLFDEAFSSFDLLSSRRIRRNINKYLKDKIVINISLNKDEVRNVDKIIVMKEGTIVEEGDYESLMNINGFFASLYKEGFSFE